MKFASGIQPIETDEVFQHISLCAPYMQLIEEFTLPEQLQFHFSFKKAMDGMNEEAMIELLGMKAHSGKQIRHFSSGMKQRLKICMSVLTDVPVLLLDEPATNLDENGLQWYKRLLQEHLKGRLLLVSSNRSEEYEMCGERIVISDFKPSA